MQSARGSIGLVVGLAVLAAAIAYALTVGFGHGTTAGTDGGQNRAVGRNRIVSLAPALTETLFAIGAADQVVGVSDFCRYPPEATKLPRVGSGIAPNYEAITRLAPTLVVNEANEAAKKHELASISTTRLLPWLSLEEVLDSTRELGKIAGRKEAGDALADKIATRLQVPAPLDAPRVLLALQVKPSKLDDVWFVRRNSLHGAVLRASGGKNALQEDVSGVPRMSLERLVEVDPEMIIVLVRDRVPDAEPVLAEWRKLGTLQAVKNDRIGVLDGREVFVNGPRILDLVDRLAVEIRRLRQ